MSGFSWLITDTSQVNFICAKSFVVWHFQLFFFRNRNIFVSSLLLIKFRTPGIQIANLPSIIIHAFSNYPLANPRNFQLVQLACYNFDSAPCCSSLSNHCCHWGTPPSYMRITGLLIHIFIYSSDSVKQEWKKILSLIKYNHMLSPASEYSLVPYQGSPITKSKLKEHHLEKHYFSFLQSQFHIFLQLLHL